MMFTLSPPLLLCPGKVFRHANKNSLSLFMGYLVIFNNMFKALNLFLNKYVIEIQLPTNGINIAAPRTTEVPHRVLTWLGD